MIPVILKRALREARAGTFHAVSVMKLGWSSTTPIVDCAVIPWVCGVVGSGVAIAGMGLPRCVWFAPGDCCLFRQPYRRKLPCICHMHMIVTFRNHQDGVSAARDFAPVVRAAIGSIIQRCLQFVQAIKRTLTVLDYKHHGGGHLPAMGPDVPKGCRS